VFGTQICSAYLQYYFLCFYYVDQNPGLKEGGQQKPTADAEVHKGTALMSKQQPSFFTTAPKAKGDVDSNNRIITAEEWQKYGSHCSCGECLSGSTVTWEIVRYSCRKLADSSVCSCRTSVPQSYMLFMGVFKAVVLIV
jgi:hypothetical protein